MVALAALDLLAQAAEDRPLLCIVDDVQWLDQATAQVLGFVGRRCWPSRWAGLCRRTTTAARIRGWVAGSAVIRAGEQLARALLAWVATARLDESVRRRILEEAHGNPLALRELGVVDFAAARDARHRQCAAAHPGPVPGAPARAAAGNPTAGAGDRRRSGRDPALLARAAHALNLDVDALQLAVDAGLLDIGAGVRFRHPLLRSAVYRAADVDERRVAHAALAEATDPHRDPDRRAWHRAYAAVAADEEVAVELIGSADRAARRGGAAAAAAFWERVVALTPDPVRRAERALVAAEAKYAAGDFAATGKLLAAADIGPLDELGHARVEFMRARIAFKLNRGAMPRCCYCTPRSGCSRWMPTWRGRPFWKHFWPPFTSGAWRMGAALRRWRGGRNPCRRTLSRCRIRSCCLRACGTGARRLRSRRAAAQRRAASIPGPTAGNGCVCHQYCVVAAELWDEEAWFEIANGQVQLARSSGALSRLVEALNGWRCSASMWGARQAEALISEEKNIQLGITESLTTYAAVLLAAWAETQRAQRTQWIR